MDNFNNGRVEKILEYLLDLTENYPERFEHAWGRQLRYWMDAIRRNAGTLRDKEKNPVPPAFRHVEEAMAILEKCGEELLQRFGPVTREILLSEYCSQVAKAFDPCLFRMSRFP